MEQNVTLVQSSPMTRSWLQKLCNLLPQFSFGESKYWASFRTKPNNKALVYLYPAKRSIRLFLPLNEDAAPNLLPTPSSSHWADRFPTVFRITGEPNLPTAAGLISQAFTTISLKDTPVKIGSLGKLINVEDEYLDDKMIDLAIIENRLRIGMVYTDSAEAIVLQRRGQDRIRRLTLMNYNKTCAICDIADPDLLVASHIVGWAEAPESRGILSNIICLCRFHDVLF